MATVDSMGQLNRVVVGTVGDMPPGSAKIVTVSGQSVGVFNVEGEYYALRNVCPHQGGPLCEGSLSGTTESDDPSEVRWVKDGEIIRCPWHHWEFDVTTGRSLFNPNRRVRSYRTVVLPAADAVKADGDDDGRDASWVVVIEWS